MDDGATAGTGLDDTGREQEGRLCRTWAEERELPRAEPKEAWPLPARPTYRLRLQARRSQGGHSRDYA